MRIDKTMYEYERCYREGYDDGYDDGYVAGCRRTFDRMLEVVIRMCDERLNDTLDAGEAPAREVTDQASR